MLSVTQPIITQNSSRKVATRIECSMPDNGQCPYCDWKCDSLKKTTYSMHISAKHTQEVGRALNPYVCTQCDKRFSARAFLNQHIANHHKITFHDCPDTNCSYQAKNKQAIMSHYASQHLPNIVKKCRETGCCTNCSRTNSVTPYHIASCHPDSPFLKTNPQIDDEITSHTYPLSKYNQPKTINHKIIFRNCPDVNCSYIAKTNTMIMSHYANKHLADITKKSKDYGYCINCSRTKDVTSHHIAKCHPLSPFSK